MRIVVLQHVACETAGRYLPVLEKFGLVETVQLGEDELPALEGYDAIVAMGGPMGTYDVSDHPWLTDETTALACALDAGVPVWGVCLGAQLLAAAAGGTVAVGPGPEVGVGTVALTADARVDPVFAEVASPLRVLHWHQDTFGLPAAAVLLATGSEYRNQAFRLGRSYGVQFHIESPWELTAPWLDLGAYRDSLAVACGPEGEEQLRRAMLEAEEEMTSLAELLMSNWLELLAASRDEVGGSARPK